MGYEERVKADRDRIERVLTALITHVEKEEKIAREKLVKRVEVLENKGKEV